MDLDPLRMTRPRVAVLKGQDTSPVTALGRQLSLEAFERYPRRPQRRGRWTILTGTRLSTTDPVSAQRPRRRLKFDSFDRN